MKIRPVGVEFYHAKRWTHGRTDRFDEANSRFVNAPKVIYFRDKEQLVCLCGGMMEMQCTLT